MHSSTGGPRGQESSSSSSSSLDNVPATIPQDGHPPQPLNLTHHRRPSPMARDSSPDSRPPAIPSVAEMPAMTRHRVPAPPSSLDAINTATTFDGQRDNLSPVGISSWAKTLTGSMSACEMPLRARAANETPTSTTAPQSPRIPPVRQNSGSSTPRVRPNATTLNIPGMTKSRISPDGKIASRDVASKLVIIMVGLPARGKSYITKKLARYLSWQQHNTKIFNVGARRRVAAGTAQGPIDSPPRTPPTSPRKNTTEVSTQSLDDVVEKSNLVLEAAQMLLNATTPKRTAEPTRLVSEEPDALPRRPSSHVNLEQTAEFFHPNNVQASELREQVALATLDELLDYLLDQGGAVGILDATNSTLERRAHLVQHIQRREPKLPILFVESICENPEVSGGDDCVDLVFMLTGDEILEANMRLKLRGPDYKDKDPEASLADFRKRVAAYESAYNPLGEVEEKRGIQYIKMIDVGRKSVQHQLRGFLPTGINNYLSTFNLSPRQIWFTRNGQSQDNVLGKLGGDSPLTAEGLAYGKALHAFITYKRREWHEFQQAQAFENHSILQAEGAVTPPYPDILGELENKNFCVWTSMMQRSMQTAEPFELDDDYDVKAWAHLNELHTGSYEGMTYDEIAAQHPEEFAKRRAHKLDYTYPGVGGEGYLQVINRVREMVKEIERITDNILIISHRSVVRVLMAYFMDLTPDAIATMELPLGYLYMVEPKPYGIDFRAYKYNEETAWFDELEGYKPKKGEP